VNYRQLLRRRLHNQQLIDSDCRTAVDVVSRLGAVQAQDYPAAQWAIGLRAPGLKAADVDAALDTGAIIRTHLLRPTWHLVAAQDVRWMLTLTAPRIRRAMAGYFRKLVLDERALATSRRTIARAVANRACTRAELLAAVRRADVSVDGLRSTFLVLDAELEGIICSGPRRGRQMTYTLLDARVPAVRAIPRDEALGKLAATYLAGHGPATARDFAWWAGLTLGEARTAFETSGSSLRCESIDECVYWFLQTPLPSPRRIASVLLLPNFDEYLVAYRDRAPITAGVASRAALSRGDLLSYRVIVDGIVSGTWKRTLSPDGVGVEVTLTEPTSSATERAIVRSAERYGAFLDRPVAITVNRHGA